MSDITSALDKLRAYAETNGLDLEDLVMRLIEYDLSQRPLENPDEIEVSQVNSHVIIDAPPGVKVVAFQMECPHEDFEPADHTGWAIRSNPGNGRIGGYASSLYALEGHKYLFEFDGDIKNAKNVRFTQEKTYRNLPFRIASA